MTKSANVNGDHTAKDRKHFVLDATVLLHNPDAIFKFEEHEVIIPLSVIEELDQYKTTNDEQGRNARDVIRHIDRLRSKGALTEGVPANGNGGVLRIAVGRQRIPDSLDQTKPANRVIAVAHAMSQDGRRTILVSNDINSRIKCDALGITAEEFLHERLTIAGLLDGWSTVTVPGELIDELYDERQIPAERIEPFLEILHEDGTTTQIETSPNYYLILRSASDSSHHGLARLLADTDHFIPIAAPRRPVYGILPRNAQQIMAMDLLLDDDVKLVTLTGSAGTGKTILAVAAGMMKVYQEERFNKLLAARPIMPLGKDIGYLPGTKDEKLSLWMQPIFDNLAYLLSSRGTHFNDAESLTIEQRIDRMIEQGKLVIEPITYIRGRSIPHQFIIVDETQNLSPHEVKTIVSRVGDGTKIVLTGDVDQIDNPYLDAQSNGLSYAAEHMKSQRVSWPHHPHQERAKRVGFAGCRSAVAVW